MNEFTCCQAKPVGALHPLCEKRVDTAVRWLMSLSNQRVVYHTGIQEPNLGVLFACAPLQQINCSTGKHKEKNVDMGNSDPKCDFPSVATALVATDFAMGRGVGSLVQTIINHRQKE